MKVWVSPSHLTERHSTHSATGAIYVRDSFTQSNGTLAIDTSLAKKTGGAVHLGAPPGGAGFEAVVGRFILVCVSSFIGPV